jgi:hypothetical protein
MAQYLIPNGPMQTTAGFAKVATGTVIKTLLQVQPSATIAMKIIEWGISFDGFAAAQPGLVELIETDVAATVTAADVNSITKWDAAALIGGNPTTNLIQVGTAATGYTASAEGSITAVRNFDLQLIAPTNQYVKQFPLGREPIIQISKFARVRVTFGASINAYTYMIVEV